MAAFNAGSMPLTRPTTTRMEVAAMTMLGEMKRWMSASLAFSAMAL